MPLTKEVITTDKAPKAIGPYSVAYRVNNLVFTAGQVGIDPATGNIVPGGIEAETRQVFENLANVLEAAGSSLENVVKTTVFLADMGDFAIMNGIYATYFTENFPARSTVQVAALPKNASVEIEVVAVAREK
ncbi:MAG TPA: RidA family protein [Anaerolineales bacterium]|nr:RidA family protein [Anaerolineales bacterium]